MTSFNSFVRFPNGHEIRFADENELWDWIGAANTVGSSIMPGWEIIDEYEGEEFIWEPLS